MGWGAESMRVATGLCLLFLLVGTTLAMDPVDNLNETIGNLGEGVAPPTKFSDANLDPDGNSWVSEIFFPFPCSSEAANQSVIYLYCLFNFSNQILTPLSTGSGYRRGCSIRGPQNLQPHRIGGESEKPPHVSCGGRADYA